MRAAEPVAGAELDGLSACRNENEGQPLVRKTETEGRSGKVKGEPARTREAKSRQRLVEAAFRVWRARSTNSSEPNGLPA